MEGERAAVAVNGALGRMGSRLCHLAATSKECRLVGAMMYAGHSSLGQSLGSLLPTLASGDAEAAAEVKELRLTADYKDLDTKPDVIIDFCSSPAASVDLARRAASDGIALVIGTTGLSDEETMVVRGLEVAGRVPVIHAMNYSLGVNLIFAVAAQLATSLGRDYNIEVTETHHKRKKDAPSGTALAIADAICGATGRTRADLRHGRHGVSCGKTEGEIGVHALRLGSVVGEHTVHYGNDFERIELTHKAQDRDAFVYGALRAAVWLKGKNAGLHEMRDVLLLRAS